MPRISYQEATAKWQRRTAAATQDYTDGVNRVQTHPGQLAARNVNGYINGIQQSVANGKWQANVQRGTLQDWQQAAVTKGAPRLAQGVQAAGPKMEAALSRVFPMIDRAVQECQQADTSTVDGRIQKAMLFMQSLNRQAQSGRGR